MPKERKDKDPVEDRAALREEEPHIDDDIETAQAKSGSVDERIPEHFGVDRAGVEAPAPGTYLPQAGIGIRSPVDEEGEGERVLEKEREARRIRKQPG
jgi:hypothetical protein